MRRKLRPHQFEVLSAVRDGRVKRVDYDYLWARPGASTHVANVSQTIYALSDLGALTLTRDGEVSITVIGEELLHINSREVVSANHHS